MNDYWQLINLGIWAISYIVMLVLFLHDTNRRENELKESLNELKEKIIKKIKEED